MKRIIAICTLGFALTACNQPQTTANIIAVVDGVQTAAITACKFVPTATTIANIVSAGSAAIPGQIADTICAAISSTKTATALMETSPSVTINGKTVVVEGHHIK